MHTQTISMHTATLAALCMNDLQAFVNTCSAEGRSLTIRAQTVVYIDLFPLDRCWPDDDQD